MDIISMLLRYACAALLIVSGIGVVSYVYVIVLARRDGVVVIRKSGKGRK